MVAFSPGAVLTAANLNTAFNALTIRTVTGVSDTLVLADNGGAVSYSNVSATTSTIPPNSSVAFAVGTKIVLINLGAGVVTVTAGAGVTVNGTLTIAQNAGGTCIKTATNTWSFLPFSSGVGAADFSDTATGTYTGFKYLTFAASGTITVTTAGFADIVVLGGGGGGGSSGAGGAGGVLAPATTVYLPAGSLTVTVGAGGAKAQTGVTSRLDNFFGVGGGSCSDDNRPGFGGGSGGGSGSQAGAGGAGVSGQGFAGGSSSAPAEGGAGGGGASAVGANAGGSGAGSTGGNGGAGTTVTLAGTTPTGAYVAGSYALGGGGGGGGRGSGGTGGSGGGGNGAINTADGTNGAANKGGGGGSSYASDTRGRPGGSGLVIVRVAV